jgi:hypothetical protein
MYMGKRDRSASTVYQIRCYLRNLRPIVWRRILVCSDASIEQLHQIISCLYGFDVSFPYRFRAAKIWYSVGLDDQKSEDVDLEGYQRSSRQVDLVDEKNVPIESLVSLVKDRKSSYDKNIFFYYESPDNYRNLSIDRQIGLSFLGYRRVDWVVVLSCEKELFPENGRHYPCCIAGELASPPACFTDARDYATFLDNRKRLDNYTLIKGLKSSYGKASKCYEKLVENNFDHRTFNQEKTNDCLRGITQS